MVVCHGIIAIVKTAAVPIYIVNRDAITSVNVRYENSVGSFYGLMNL